PRNLLGRMLAAIDLSLEEVYLTGVLKCLPADRNLAAAQESGTCLSWLRKEVELLNPGIILTLGPLSARLLLETDKQLFTLRGRLQKWRNTPLIASYHPEMLLRHQELKKASWQDLKLIKSMI
ncbi:MAG: uracil-DNA glycosylase, partial [Desulfobia sp.]